MSSKEYNINMHQSRIIALAGNPNVGKSTVFNGLTGLKQHTGNWSGKTVSYAKGTCQYAGRQYTIVDIPGTYSLLAHSQEEEVARDYLCFQQLDAVIVVCDATCLERNLNLVLQILELRQNVVVCVNLLDEAAKKGITVDLERLKQELGVPVVGTVAHQKSCLPQLLQAVETVLDECASADAIPVRYPQEIEWELAAVERDLPERIAGERYRRWLSVRLLEDDAGFRRSWEKHQPLAEEETERLKQTLAQSRQRLQSRGAEENLTDEIVTAILHRAQTIAGAAVHFAEKDYNKRDRRLDKILTGKYSGYLCMLIFLVGIFWLTIVGANYPSQLLSRFFAWSEGELGVLLLNLSVPEVVCDALLTGVWRTVGWVVAVMLPPMAIFFPLFTVLEDVGYLPRIAYNLDRPFKCCHACGKQALTMCMGLGCNAVGVIGCRIIDSPRERLLAVLTNALVPCNGRLPTLIALFGLLLPFQSQGWLASLWRAIGLSILLVLSLGCTFLATKILSQTILKGLPSSFVLELPAYRKPQIGKIVVRSVFDRTLFVLKRAVIVAAPAGLLLWFLANFGYGGMSLLAKAAQGLDGAGSLLGLDGVILLAFVLGLPANEIVVPIIIMSYLAQGGLTEMAELSQIQALFWANGWSTLTVVCFLLFTLLHWPCATTLWTIKKETGSWHWSALAALIPTAMGIILCLTVNVLGQVLF